MKTEPHYAVRKFQACLRLIKDIRSQLREDELTTRERFELREILHESVEDAKYWRSIYESA